MNTLQGGVWSPILISLLTQALSKKMMKSLRQSCTVGGGGGGGLINHHAEDLVLQQLFPVCWSNGATLWHWKDC